VLTGSQKHHYALLLQREHCYRIGLDTCSWMVIEDAQDYDFANYLEDASHSYDYSHFQFREVQEDYSFEGFGNLNREY
jgi:hypothetical protein